MSETQPTEFSDFPLLISIPACLAVAGVISLFAYALFMSFGPTYVGTISALALTSIAFITTISKVSTKPVLTQGVAVAGIALGSTTVALIATHVAASLGAPVF